MKADCSSVLYWVYTQSFGSRGREPADVTSVRRGQRVPCAEHSWFQPAHKQTHLTPKLRQSAKVVVPLRKHILKKAKIPERREKKKYSLWRGQCWSRYLYCILWRTPWQSWWIFPERTASHGETMLEQMLLIGSAVCGGTMLEKNFPERQQALERTHSRDD